MIDIPLFLYSPEYKNPNLHYRKIRIIQGMLNIFYILSEKSGLFLEGGGSTTPPPDRGHVR